jgi:predicted outer membrane protein
MAATRSLIAVLAVALAPACSSDSNDDVVVDDPVGDTQDEGFARGTALADHASDELSGDDYTIVIGKTATILAALNDGEIDQSSFAVQVVSDDDVFQLANDLIVDHEDANAELDDVVRSYGINYLPSSAADALAGEASAGLSLLRSSPPGEVDFQFVQLQVINHAEAQVLLDELQLQVGAGEMGDYIANTRDMVNDHFDHASALLDTYY